MMRWPPGRRWLEALSRARERSRGCYRAAVSQITRETRRCPVPGAIGYDRERVHALLELNWKRGACALGQHLEARASHGCALLGLTLWLRGLSRCLWGAWEAVHADTG